jgi:hypothetical protein
MYLDVGAGLRWAFPIRILPSECRLVGSKKWLVLLVVSDVNSGINNIDLRYREQHLLCCNLGLRINLPNGHAYASPI